MDDESYVLRKDQWLTYEDGRRYFKAARDIGHFEAISHLDFVSEDGTHPEPYTAIPNDVITWDGQGNMMVHVEEGWRRLKNGNSEIVTERPEAEEWMTSMCAAKA